MKELFEAVRAADVSRMEELVKADPSLAIFAAAIQGRTQEVEDLIAGNRSLASGLSSDGWTPLHLAAFFGHKETAQALLNKGALVDARSANAMQNTPLHAAASARKSDVAKMLLERGAAPNARQHGGWTPLHSAAQNGDVPMAEILLAAGADVQARAENHQGALDIALTKGHQRLVDLLEKNGAHL
jgi:ankyrin repeat protein